MAPSQEHGSVTASIQYLARTPVHDLEKPYYLYYDYDFDIPRTNTTADHRSIVFHNARDILMPSKDMFHEFGFTMMNLDCPLRPEEYFDSTRVEQVYYPKCVALIKGLFPDAARVEILEHGARRRDKDFPHSGKERHEYSQNQPSDYVHIDFTASSAEKSGRKRFDLELGQYRRVVAVKAQMISVWRPIRGPVYDFPLTLCDRRTVNCSTQTISMDIVTQSYENENTRVYFDEAHKWYFWEGLKEDEALVFMQSDSDREDEAGVPHTAFKDPRVGEDVQRRESVEVRVFVYFD